MIKTIDGEGLRDKPKAIERSGCDAVTIDVFGRVSSPPSTTKRADRFLAISPLGLVRASPDG